MGRCLPRYLGCVELLPIGMWTLDARDTRPAVRCPLCGGIDHVEGRYHVGATGVVTPEYGCQTATCCWRAWLTLELFEFEVIT